METTDLLTQFTRIDSGEGNSVTPSTEQAYTGAQSAKFTNGGISGQNIADVRNLNLNTVHVQIPVFLDPAIQIDQYINLCRAFGDGGQPFTVWIGNDHIQFSDPESWSGALPALTRGAWHILDVYYSGNTGLGYIKFVVDGVVRVEKWIDLTSYNITRVAFGNVWSGQPVTGIFFLDDLSLDEYTPPPPPPQNPVASFLVSRVNPQPNDVVAFDATASYDPDGTIVDYSWNMGDGTVLNGVQVTHSYPEGQYDVVLTVTDNDGMAGQAMIRIFARVPQPPQAPVGWDLPLKVAGKMILDSKNNDVTRLLTGAAKMGLEYSKGTNRETNPTYFEEDAQRMHDWGIRFVRVGFNGEWYMNDPDYHDIVKLWVDTLTSKGMAILMDCHKYGDIGTPTQGTPETAWVEVEPWIVALENVAVDFLYNPNVIGVEVNEFWAVTNRQDLWIWNLQMNQRLAERIHTINPNLLIFWNPGFHDLVQEDKLIQGMPIITEPNVVFAPHIYQNEQYYPWLPGTAGETSGYDAWTYYAVGDVVTGKTLFYHYMDIYKKHIQDLYNMPCVVTEWATGGNEGWTDDPNKLMGYIQELKDQFDYFQQNNWGSSYWAYFGRPAPKPPTLNLLDNDWVNPTPQGVAFKEKLATLPIPPIQKAGFPLWLPLLVAGGATAYYLLKKGK